MHPGVVAGFFFAAIFAILLIGVAMFFVYKRLKDFRLSANESSNDFPKKQNEESSFEKFNTKNQSWKSGKNGVSE